MAKPTLPQLKRLIGNPDVVAEQDPDGSYHPDHVDHYAGGLNEVLQRHLSGKQTFGTYVVKPPDQARTLIFDLDDESLAKAKLAAFEIHDTLRKLGVPPRCLGIEFSGKKGYHVWLPLSDYTDARTLRHVGMVVTGLAGIQCEVFPKQDHVSGDGLGNLCKLPGSIHQETGKENNFLQAVPHPLNLAQFRRIVAGLPAPPEHKRTEAPVALGCMQRVQDGLGKGERNRGLFQFCTHLRRASVAESVLVHAAHQVNRNFDPPLDDGEVERIIESSRTSGPICRQLSSDLACDDCPIMREKGLYTKPGQLRHGAEGELVVVELGQSRKDGFRDIVHPDVNHGVVSVE